MQRRRFLKVLAAPVLLPTLTPGNGFALTDFEKTRWRGVVMGAPAEMTLYGESAEQNQHVLRVVQNEIDRLENIFSLYRPQTSLVQLNKTGRLASPPAELLELLTTCTQISRLTNGSFDATVQPLWNWHQQNVSKKFCEQFPAPQTAIPDEILRLVDYKRVNVTPQRILFELPNMEITLNGIAQGFVTEHIANQLRDFGYKHVLLDLGELCAIGTHASDRPWRVAVESPGESSTLPLQLALQDKAMATSAGKICGSTSRSQIHLFDPQTGTESSRYAGVSVIAQSATWADGLSTAFSNMTLQDMRKSMAEIADATVVIIHHDRSVTTIGNSDFLLS